MTIELFWGLVVGFAIGYMVFHRPHRPATESPEALHKVQRMLIKEGRAMGLGEDILAKVRAQDTIIDSVRAYIESLRGRVISDAVATSILAEIDANSADLSTAIVEGTPNA